MFSLVGSVGLGGKGGLLGAEMLFGEWGAYCCLFVLHVRHHRMRFAGLRGLPRDLDVGQYEGSPLGIHYGCLELGDMLTLASFARMACSALLRSSWSCLLYQYAAFTPCRQCLAALPVLPAALPLGDSESGYLLGAGARCCLSGDLPRRPSRPRPRRPAR